MIHLTPEQRVFVLERHVATLTTLREDGSPHVTPVAFTWDAETGVAWLTSEDTAVKVRNVEAADAAGRPARAALCQVSGGRWLTLEGALAVRRAADVVAEAERRYALRYGVPLDPDPRRVVLHLTVSRVLGAPYMTR